MNEIRVERTLRAPIEGVFEVISDHASYDRFRGIRRSALLRSGSSEPNGLGAMRRIAVGPLRFQEEITAFERPNRMDYLIVKLNIPFRHHGGSIRLKPAAGGDTHAVWTSSYEIPVPLVGGALASVFAFALKRGFARVLERTDELLREPEAATSS